MIINSYLTEFDDNIFMIINSYIIIDLYVILYLAYQVLSKQVI